MLGLVVICLVFLLIQPRLLVTDESEPATQSENSDESESDRSPNDKLAEARTKNPDVYAWIRIPEIGVDYPVLQSRKSDKYYLKRDSEGHFSSSGAIMSEKTYNGTDFEDPVTILYGQCMKSGAMFGSLQTFYSSEDGLEENRSIEIYLPDRKLEYEVFAAVPFDARHILSQYDFSDEKVFTDFFDTILAIRAFNATVSYDRKPIYGDKVLILSTTLKGDSTQRYLVLARIK